MPAWRLAYRMARLGKIRIEAGSDMLGRVVAAAGALSLLAGAAGAADQVKIGFIATLSGPSAALGQDLGFHRGIIASALPPTPARRTGLCKSDAA